MMRSLVIAFALCALVPSGSSGVVLVNPDGSPAQPFQGWVGSAHVPTPDRTVVIHRELDPLCGPADACTNLTEIWIDASGCARACRFYFGHELGHIFLTGLPQWKRRRFVETTHNSPDWSSTDLTGDSTEERFADAYSQCLWGRRLEYIDVSASTVEPLYQILSRRTFRRVCHLLRIPDTRKAP
jgi:hypothetical protein